MISLQTLISGFIAGAFIAYFAGQFLLTIFQHRQNKIDGKELRECGYCAQQSSKCKRCTGCKAIYYCSVKCQASHWTHGHKKRCKVSKRIKKKKKKKMSEKKREFMKMLESLTGNNDEDESDSEHKSSFNEETVRKQFRQMIDSNKLKRKYVTFYSFKALGYCDKDIPPFEGDESFGEEQVSMNEMIDSMIMTKKMLIRDPELKREMNKKIMSYKQHQI